MREIKLLGKLPDPFLKDDGTRVSPQEWKEYKKELLEKIVDFEYGGMPPRPEVVRFERLNMVYRGESRLPTHYRIFAGTKEKQLSFVLELYIPYIEGVSTWNMNGYVETENYPVILTGDGCYPNNMDDESRQEILKRGFVAARFNRCEIANDVKNSREGGIHEIYEGNYSDISAWAWGYMVCMDVIEQLPFLNEKEVAITGHSRGGKTVLLAGALDERFKYVCPNNSGCHGAVSHRCVVTHQGDADVKTETVTDMIKNFPTWLGEKLVSYENKLDELPYDMHYFGAMIAPRFYMQCEGLQDYWINPVGAWHNFMAVKECYKYLGCEENAVAWFRPGEHRHTFPDYYEFIDFMDRAMHGLEVKDHLKTNPYPEIEKNFDW